MGYRKRGDRWLVTVELGRDERGIRRRKHITCTSEEEAKREDAVLTAAVLTGTCVEDSRESMAEFLQEWLRHAGRGKERRTVDAYAYAVKGHLVPVLQAAVPPTAAPSARQALHDGAGGEGSRPGHDRQAVLCPAQRNPSDGVEKPGQQDSDARSFDITEQAAILGRRTASATPASPWCAPALRSPASSRTTRRRPM
jgi:hypothetical protein